MDYARRLPGADGAAAFAAVHADARLGTGYPGTHLTEILERFDPLGRGARSHFASLPESWHTASLDAFEMGRA